jgi:hypothetical protein
LPKLIGGMLQSPVAGSHVSSPGQASTPAHVPPAQTSPAVHATPSSHGLVLVVYWHVPVLHASSVHGLESSQSASASHA